MIDGLSQLAQRMKSHNSINLIQLCHAGSRAIQSLTGVKPHSASSYSMPMVPDFESPESLSIEEIKEIISDFANACVRVEEAGFDGVEFHGANGFLITQFISLMTNLRTDIYGGDLVNRSRFAREVVTACRKRVSKDFIIGFKMSFENMGFETGLDIDENIQIINWLAEDGINYVHTSHMNYAAKTSKYPDQISLQYLRNKITSALPLVGVGGILSCEDAEKAIEYGADIVAIGRAAIGNKKLPEYFEDREALQIQMPYPETKLKEIGISNSFIDYLKNGKVAVFNIVAK